MLQSTVDILHVCHSYLGVRQQSFADILMFAVSPMICTVFLFIITNPCLISFYFISNIAW